MEDAYGRLIKPSSRTLKARLARAFRFCSRILCTAAYGASSYPDPL